MDDLIIKVVVGFLGILVSAFVGLVIWLVKDRGAWSRELATDRTAWTQELAKDREAHVRSTSELTQVLGGLKERVGFFGEKVEKLEDALTKMGIAITTFGSETVRLNGRLDAVVERVADRPTRKEVTDEVTASRHTIRNELTEPLALIQLRLLELEKKP